MNPNEIDGGFTVDEEGKRARIVLDDRGVFLRLEATDAPPAPPSALDVASQAAAAAQPLPAALTLVPDADAPHNANPPGAAPAVGFKVPT